MSKALFDGVAGMLVGKMMAAGNAPAEAEALEYLSPSPSDAVLVIGFGPGVGLSLLADRLVDGYCVGVDPSGAMLKLARKRCAEGIAAGRIRLQKTTAVSIDASDAMFDGAVAVNALQLCEPFAPTAIELSRVMKRGAPLVSLTHDWAAERHAGSVEAWTQRMANDLAMNGFSAIAHGRGRSENGRIVRLTAQRQ